jgi:hypothetical protein
MFEISYQSWGFRKTSQISNNNFPISHSVGGKVITFLGQAGVGAEWQSGLPSQKCHCAGTKILVPRAPPPPTHRCTRFENCEEGSMRFLPNFGREGIQGLWRFFGVCTPFGVFIAFLLMNFAKILGGGSTFIPSHPRPPPVSIYDPTPQKRLKWTKNLSQESDFASKCCNSDRDGGKRPDWNSA